MVSGVHSNLMFRGKADPGRNILTATGLILQRNYDNIVINLAL